MMAYHKPAIALAATLSALSVLSMGALVFAADLSNDAFDQKFTACGQITGSPSLACRNEARAMTDRAMADIRVLRNPNPGSGEAK